MRTILKVSALVILGAVLIVFYLMRFHGLKIERDGSGLWPILSFQEPEKHLAEIQRNRVEPEKTASAPQRKPYWTDFRGPHRDGRYEEMPIVTSWSPDGPRRLWRKPIGGGYASFVLAGDRAFTIEQRGDQEVVVAYDLKSGGEVWSHGWKGHFQEAMGGDGPRATPTCDDDRIYALGAHGELRCLDAETGRRIWSKNILDDNGAHNLQWGMAASPLIVEDKLIVLPGGPGGRSVVAYSKLSGEPLWRALDDKQSYCSPMLVTLAGKRQLLIVSAGRAVGLTVEEGSLLWEYPWSTSYDINASQPVIVGPDRFLLSAGYDHGAALVRVTAAGGAFSATRVWENNRLKNKFTSSVLHEGHVYGLDEAIMACIRADSGELKWKGGRYGYGQIVLAGGHIIVLAENGDIALVRANPERHQELVRFAAIEGKTWNHPAIAGGILLVRNATEMTAFRITESVLSRR